MEGDSRKRAASASLSSPDDEEEEKMERFFTLIRNIRASKEGMLKGGNQSKHKKPKEDRAAVWTPTFEWEDFMQEINLKTPAIFSNPSKNPSKEKENEENTRLESLDLNLSLSI